MNHISRTLGGFVGGRLTRDTRAQSAWTATSRMGRRMRRLAHACSVRAVWERLALAQRMRLRTRVQPAWHTKCHTIENHDCDYEY